MSVRKKTEKYILNKILVDDARRNKVSSWVQMSPVMTFCLFRLLPLVFIVSGACFAYDGIRYLIKSSASVDWPTTQGKVEESSYESHRTGSIINKVTSRAKIK